MQSDISSQLETLKVLAYVQVGLLLVLVVIVVGVLAGRVLVGSTRLEAKLRQDFVQQAQALEEQGKLEQLVELSEKRARAVEQDISAHWYKGKALFRLGQFGPALVSLSKVKEIDPAWNKGLVEKYISETRARLEGPNGIVT